MPENPRPRMQDVAAEAGVSLGTVSNVLNHPDKVRPETVAKVLAVVQALGFSRNSMASSLARGSTATFGLVVIDLSNSMFVDMARGAQKEAREAGFHLQLASGDDDELLLEQHVDIMNKARVTGLLVAPLTEPSRSVQISREHGCPVVILNHDDPALEACRVLIDNEHAGYIAAAHLIELGRREIAFVAASPHLQPVHLRLQGAKRAVAEHADTVTLTEYWLPSLDASEGAGAGSRLASAARRPDAVLAVTDVLAMALTNELAAAGVQVPGDVAVMGCDHNSAAWGGAIPLSSVSMEGGEMGRLAVQLLIAELEEDPAKHEHVRIVLQPSLVLRESTEGRG